MSRIKKAVLIGYGNVGRGFYQALQARHIDGITLDAVVVKNRNKQREIPVYFDALAAADSAHWEVVIEAIDDADVAFQIARRALLKGKTVISASKKMLAKYLPELKDLELAFGGTLLYEAAVAGGVPVLQTADQYLANDEVKQVRSILNGTTNYILTQTFQYRIDPAEALRRAQEAGFAESDPRNDVSGADARSKLILLIERLWGIVLREEEVLTFGIEYLNADDVRYSREQWKELRLVAQAERIGGEVYASVLPTWVSAEDTLSTIRAEHNAVVFDAERLGQITLTGAGAGSGPTGQAVWNDVWQAAQGVRYKRRSSSLQRAEDAGKEVEVYIRYRKDALRTELPFTERLEGYISDGFSFLRGFIRISDLKNYKEVLQRDRATVIATGRVRIAQEVPLQKVYRQRQKVAS